MTNKWFFFKKKKNAFCKRSCSACRNAGPGARGPAFPAATCPCARGGGAQAALGDESRCTSTVGMHAQGAIAAAAGTHTRDGWRHTPCAHGRPPTVGRTTACSVPRSSTPRRAVTGATTAPSGDFLLLLALDALVALSAIASCLRLKGKRCLRCRILLRNVRGCFQGPRCIALCARGDEPVVVPKAALAALALFRDCCAV